MPGMTIEELVKAKRQLEQDMLALIQEFESRNGNRIRISQIRVSYSSHPLNESDSSLAYSTDQVYVALKPQF